MPKLLICCALRCRQSPLFCALRCCLLLLQLCLVGNHLRSSAFSPFFTCFFVTFVFFTLRCHLFLFIKSCALHYYLSFLLPDEACGRNVVNSTVCCSLNYVNTFRPRWMPELLLCCALRCSHCRLFCALRSCLMLFQICLLRSSSFSPFFTGFCHFRNFYTSLSPIFHTSLSPFFFINSCAFA